MNLSSRADPAKSITRFPGFLLTLVIIALHSARGGGGSDDVVVTADNPNRRYTAGSGTLYIAVSDAVNATYGVLSA